ELGLIFRRCLCVAIRGRNRLDLLAGRTAILDHRHQVTDDLLADQQAALDLANRTRLHIEVDQEIARLAKVLDGIRQSALAPWRDLGQAASRVDDRARHLLHGGLELVVLQVRSEQQHECVSAHGPISSSLWACGIRRPRRSPPSVTPASISSWPTAWPSPGPLARFAAHRPSRRPAWSWRLPATWRLASRSSRPARTTSCPPAGATASSKPGSRHSSSGQVASRRPTAARHPDRWSPSSHPRAASGPPPWRSIPRCCSLGGITSAPDFRDRRSCSSTSTSSSARSRPTST